MLIPIKQLYPIRVEAATTFTTALETQLPVLPIMQPRIFFKNTHSTASVTVNVTHILNLGVSDDPLLTGTFTTVIVDHILGPGELLTHVFLEVALTEELVNHTWSVTNATVTDTVIVQVWVEGFFEESLKAAPQFLPIVI